MALLDLVDDEETGEHDAAVEDDELDVKHDAGRTRPAMTRHTSMALRTAPGDDAALA